jgi:hypothetical protein
MQLVVKVGETASPDEVQPSRKIKPNATEPSVKHIALVFVD